MASVDRLCGLLLAVVLLTSTRMVMADDAAVPSSPASADWSLRLPAFDTVHYQGLADFDAAGGGPGAMLYPAPNVGGLLAAIVTHGLLVESAKRSEREKIRSRADKVIEPYRPLLERFSTRDLLQRAADRMSTPGRKAVVDPHAVVAGWWIEMAPLFSMTPDGTAVVLDNAVAVYGPGADAMPAYRNGVRVVSRAVDADDPVSFWSAEDGEALKDASARLLAESLDVAITQIGAPAQNAPQRTFRFSQGRVEAIERAELVEDRCDRVVVRTLRGWLMSFPAGPTPEPACRRPAGSHNVVRPAQRD